MFVLFRNYCLLYKALKIVCSQFILTIYDMGIQGVTRGYRGLQGFTRGYKGLQWVTRGYTGLQGVRGGYKGLQGVTWCDKGLQGVTMNYRNFFLTRTFPDTLL